MNILIILYIVYFIVMFLLYDLWLINGQGQSDYDLWGADIFFNPFNISTIEISFIFALLSPFIILWVLFMLPYWKYKDYKYIKSDEYKLHMKSWDMCSKCLKNWKGKKHSYKDCLKCKKI